MLVTKGEEYNLLTVEDVKNALVYPLPGEIGQRKMAPAPIEGQINRWETPDTCQEASVLLLIYPHNRQDNGLELHLALTRRPEYPGVHGGQISLPGGRRERDETLEETALRETAEEIGVASEDCQLIGQLTTLYTPPSNFCIYPFVAVTPTRPNFEPDPVEVAELIEVPLSLFFDSAVWKEEVWYLEKYGERLIPFFDVYGHKVWGATAMILSEFLTLLQK